MTITDNSDLLSIRPEILSEIIALDFQITNLLLKVQGNYAELKRLLEVLNDVSANLNLEQIQKIPKENENDSQPIPFTMLDLPIDQQSIIFGTAAFSGMLVSFLEPILGSDLDYFLNHITEQVGIALSDYKDEEITAVLAKFLTQRLQNPGHKGFRVEVSTDS